MKREEAQIIFSLLTDIEVRIAALRRGCHYPGNVYREIDNKIKGIKKRLRKYLSKKNKEK